MYPTPEQILNTEMELDPSAIAIVAEWKAKHFKGWRDKDHAVKISALKNLIEMLAKHYCSSCRVISDYPYFFYENETINIGFMRPSIISTLHEFYHHIDRHNNTTRSQKELLACRWSVQMFKRVFPKSFEKLRFHGHLLVLAGDIPNE